MYESLILYSSFNHCEEFIFSYKRMAQPFNFPPTHKRLIHRGPRDHRRSCSENIADKNEPTGGIRLTELFKVLPPV